MYVRWMSSEEFKESCIKSVGSWSGDALMQEVLAFSLRWKEG